MRRLLEGLHEVDDVLEAELIVLTKDLAPVEVAQVLADELGLNGLYQNILQGRIQDMEHGR